MNCDVLEGLSQIETDSIDTGISCKNLNRKFIGIELNKEIYDIAEQRINKASEQVKLI